MRKNLYLLTPLLLWLFFSCQKERSFEVGGRLVGSLQNTAGECLPKTVGGAYVAQAALTDSNFIEVDLNATTTGSYTVTSDTLNGYSFKGSGVVGATGPARIRLKGIGTPDTSGVNTFTIQFDSSSCAVAVTVLPAGSNSVAVYTLSGAGGACMNAQVVGTYTQGAALTSGNKVDIQLNVTSVGTYTINTNTVNGFSFGGTGTLGATGLQTVSLTGTGTPVTTDSTTFTVTANGAACTVKVGVSAPPVVPNCNATPSSSAYTAGTPLTASNTVSLQHTYTTAGTYTVTTGTVNGYSFSSNVTATAGAATTITLTGTGTPTAAGTNMFTVSFGDNTSCTFTINVNPASTTSAEYFPLTTNSWWSYNDAFVSGDTMLRKVIGDANSSAQTYRHVEESYEDGSDEVPYYFRKGGTDYYEFTLADWYSELKFDSPVEGEILYLKVNLTANQQWFSDEFNGQVMTVAKKLRYKFTCTSINTTLSVNGKSFSNVYTILMKPQTSTGGSAFADEPTTLWEFNYAPGVGLIKYKATYGTTTYTWDIRNWKVN